MLSVYDPSAVGANETFTVTDAPGASAAPGAGTPVAANGAAGKSTESIVSGALPMFETTTLPASVPPTVVPPKLTAGGDTVSSATALRPVPLSEIAVVPVFVVTARVAAFMPDEAGVNVTGTLSVPPAPSAAGSAGVGAPTVNSAEELVTLVTVTGPDAVSTAVCDPDCPIITAPKSTFGPVTGTEAGVPNPMTCPSRVPT